MATKEWPNHEQAVTAETYLKANRAAGAVLRRYNWLEQSYQYRVSWRVQRWSRCVGTILWWCNWLEQSCPYRGAQAEHHGLMSSTLCCLLPRAYGAWRAEPCQKHLQRLLPGLTERWVLLWMRMWGGGKKIDEVFEAWCIQRGRV